MERREIKKKRGVVDISGVFNLFSKKPVGPGKEESKPAQENREKAGEPTEDLEGIRQRNPSPPEETKYN